MAKVIQDPVQASIQKAFPAASPTTTVFPAQISPVRVSGSAVFAEGLSQLGGILGNFAATKGRLDFKKEQLAINQQTKVIKAKARADLLQIVNSAVDDTNLFPDDPFGFDPNEAKAAIRSSVLSFMSGDRGFLIDNDTLRLALTQGNALADSLTPATTVKLEGGRLTTVQEFDGETKVNTVVIDENAAALNDMGFLANTHPILVQNILNNDDLTFDEKVEAGDELTERIAVLRESQLMSKIAKSRAPVFDKSEVVRTSLARNEFFGTLVGQSDIAMSALVQTKFDPLVPGAMNNLADEYEADMNNILLTDPSVTDLTEAYEVDVFALVQDQSEDYISSQADWLRSLDTLNVKKQGAAAAVANMTEVTAKLKQADAEFRGNVISPKQRFFAVAGQNLSYGQMYETQLRDAGKTVPEYDHMVKAMALASSRFEAMGTKIRELKDDDTEETRRATQQIMGEFFIDATNWSKREYLDSLDIKGFVSAMALMRESGVFERLEPENFKLLENIYSRAKAIPAHTNLFEKLERNDDVSLELLESYRESIRQQISERGTQ